MSRGWAPLTSVGRGESVAKFRQGPSPAGYSAEPVPRVTGEDLNGCDGGNGVHWYGGAGGRGIPNSEPTPRIGVTGSCWSCTTRHGGAIELAAEETSRGPTAALTVLRWISVLASGGNRP